MFTGVNYDFWDIRMRTIFKSYDLWKFVDVDFEIPEESDEQLIEKEKIVVQDRIARDTKALGLIQGAISYKIFPMIANQETAKAVWDVLQQEYR